MPADVPAADKARLTESYRAAIAMKIQPALKRLRDFLHAEYLPKARIGVGLSQMPGGAAYYAYLVERQTTTEMSPEEIHRLGLNEVARIKRGMEAIRSEEHTSELQSLMRSSYAIFCLKKNKQRAPRMASSTRK